MNLRFSVSPVMIDDKNTAGYVWCFDDVTELRLLERQMRQKEQMAAIGAMSAGIAHEIRNPLASITGSFKLLQSDLQLDPDQNQLVEIITRETDRLNRTITDFLCYARPLSPNLQGGRSVGIDFRNGEADAKQSGAEAGRTGLKPGCGRSESNVDESMMRQVFYNLASNAFKAMPDGGTLTIISGSTNWKSADPIRRYRRRIGRGRDEDGCSFRSIRRSGTGPDWACRSFTRSSLPITARYRCEVPKGRGNNLHHRSLKCQKRAKILIVDDERSIRELLEIFLKKEGFDVTSRRERRRRPGTRSRPTEFDLIISDIKMADMSGIDLLRQLREHELQRPVHSADGLCQRRDGDSGTEDGRLRLHPQDRKLHRRAEAGRLQRAREPPAPRREHLPAPRVHAKFTGWAI